jgi:hypothetical protein
VFGKWTTLLFHKKYNIVEKTKMLLEKSREKEKLKCLLNVFHCLLPSTC